MIPESKNMVSESKSNTLRVPGSAVRGDFPFFDDEHGPTRAFLDTAASAQKPRIVVEAMQDFLLHEYANIHRGAYDLSAQATARYDAAREKVGNFIGAPDPRTVVFTRGATEAINLVAYSLGEQLKEGDVIALSVLEHHSNIVPWQILAERKKLHLNFVGIDKHANLNMEELRSLLETNPPALLAITGLSNAFGTVTPLKEIIAMAHKQGVKVLVDAAQLIVHTSIDVKELDVDFLVFSGHKLYGPTGIGALYAKYEHLESLPPFQGGGDMISQVSTEGSSWALPPQKFEAGTPAIAEAIGLGAAIDFMKSFRFEDLHEHERRVFEYGYSSLEKEEGVTLYGPVTGKSADSVMYQASILPFTVEGAHPHDVASIADTLGVQIRAGHHCAMPAIKALGLQSTCRASLGLYSETSDIDMLIESIRHARKIFSG